MSRVRMLLLLFLVLVPRAQAQRTFAAEYTAEVGPGATVSLRLDGDVTVRATSGSEVRLVTRTTYHGRVFGYANQPAEGAFRLRVRREGTGLSVEPEPRRPLLVAGVSTVREQTRTDVQVPRAARLLLRVRRGEVRIHGLAAHVEVECGRGAVHLFLEDRDPASLSARTDRGTVRFGGLDAGPEMFRTGTGAAAVVLRVRRGDIHLNPFHEQRKQP